MFTVPRRGFGAVLLWACFLGASWTWVIGLVLPALLVRDYGVWGWVVFALPNVLGAGAMGFVIRNQTRSKRLVEKHRGACFWFSLVTLGFHLFVIAWLLPPLIHVGLAVMVVAVGLGYGAIERRGEAAALAGAVAVAGLSYGAFVVAQGLPGAWSHAGTSLSHSRLGLTGLVAFVPASVAGFTLCPYLDLTFHRARQGTDPMAGRGAFAAGFGVVFLLMIFFSWCYAGLIQPVIAGRPFQAPPVWRALLGIHLVIQIVFTMALHLREVRETADRGRRWGGVVVILAATFAGYLTRYLPDLAGMSPGEVGYRGFMVFYGVAFPGYVWLCMIPTRGRLAWKTKARVYALAVVPAMPMGWVGFIAGPGWWMLAALGVLLAARGAIEAMAWRQAAPSRG